MIRIHDDSGFLGLIDPATYSSFISADWTFDMLSKHVVREMARGRLLIWNTGNERIWQIEIRDRHTNQSGYRSAMGSIFVTDGRLCVVNYESLSMAAQYRDLVLPEEHLKDCTFTIANGHYQCKIIQLDAQSNSSGRPASDTTDFVLEFKLTEEAIAPWNQIMWHG